MSWKPRKPKPVVEENIYCRIPTECKHFHASVYGTLTGCFVHCGKYQLDDTIDPDKAKCYKPDCKEVK